MVTMTSGIDDDSPNGQDSGFSSMSTTQSVSYETVSVKSGGNVSEVKRRRRTQSNESFDDIKVENVTVTGKRFKRDVDVVTDRCQANEETPEFPGCVRKGCPDDMEVNNANTKGTSPSSNENCTTEEKYVADDTGLRPCESLRDVIIHHYPMIKREIEPRFLLDKLIEKSIIDEDRAEYIRTTGYRKKRVDILFHAVIRQSESTRTKFINVLVDDYAYLAKELSVTGQRRREVEVPSETKENLEYRLLTYREEILSELMQLIQDEILDDFLQAFVFSVEDHEEVTSGGCTRSRAEIFFKILLRTLPCSYKVLCECLEARDKVYILDILRNRPKTAGEQIGTTRKEKSQNEKGVCRTVNLKLTQGEMICNTAGTLSPNTNLKLTIEMDSNTPRNIEINIIERAKETELDAITCMRSSFLGSNIGSVVIHLKSASRNLQMDLRRCVTHGFLDTYIKSLFQKEDIINHFIPGNYNLTITIAKDRDTVCELHTKALGETKEATNCIKLNRPLLIEEIEPLEFVPLMKKKGIKIFDDIHFEYITSRRQRADEFLKCVEYGGNEALDAFLDVVCDVGLNELYQILYMSTHNRNSETLAFREKILDHFPDIVNEIEPKALVSVLREDFTFSSDFVSTISDSSKSRRERCIEFLKGILHSADHAVSGLVEALKSSGHSELASKLETTRFDEKQKYNFVKIRHMHGENGIIFKGNMMLTVSEDIVEAAYKMKQGKPIMEDKCAQAGFPYVNEEVQNSEILESLNSLSTEQKSMYYAIEQGMDNRRKHKESRRTQTPPNDQWGSSSPNSTDKLEEEEDWKSRCESLRSDLECVESELERIEHLKDKELIQSSQIISKQYRLIVRLYTENLNSQRKCFSVLEETVDATNRLNKLKAQLKALGGNPDKF